MATRGRKERPGGAGPSLMQRAVENVAARAAGSLYTGARREGAVSPRVRMVAKRIGNMLKVNEKQLEPEARTAVAFYRREVMAEMRRLRGGTSNVSARGGGGRVQRMRAARTTQVETRRRTPS